MMHRDNYKPRKRRGRPGEFQKRLTVPILDKQIEGNSVIGLNDTHFNTMKLTFKIERGGRDYALVKHPRDRKKPDANLAPWYLRHRRPDGKYTWKKCGDADQPEAAIAYATELLRTVRQGAHPYTQLVEATRYRQTLTVGALVKDWASRGYPLPNGTPRHAGAQTQQSDGLARALEFWGAKPIKAITPRAMHDYMAHRRGNVTRGTGERTVDLELTTLSNCCQWALARGDIEQNPFASRPRFKSESSVKHCHLEAPADDDELHAIARFLFSQDDHTHVIAGAQLLFQAMTGLRPGEPGFLGRHASNGPGRIDTVTIDDTPRRQMLVQRLKNGINPAVWVHSALAKFLEHWESWLIDHYPDSKLWFPHPRRPSARLQAPRDTTSPVNNAMNLAVEALKLPPRRPHAMRAYYVQVRRSQGADDATIALEMGERSGPSIIVRTYGDPRQAFATGRFDWLPDNDLKPAWETLPTTTKPNIIAL